MLDFNIITFHRSINYGAVLQTYALQEFIAKQGFSVGIFDYIKPRNDATNATIRAKISRVLSILFKNKRNISIQSNKFEDFGDTFLKLNLETSSRIFVTGSDQVWNLNQSMNSMYFLQFLDSSSYKISYAASMAKTNIPNDKRRILEKYLSSFDAISVREQGIKDSLCNIYKNEISVNIDPTLLHDKSFYKKLSKQVKKLPKKYILVYFLHIPKNGNRMVRWLRKCTNLPVVILDTSGKIGIFIKNDMLVKDAGPKEFISLFENAECVVTTSFHGTCFSLIFEKEFYSIVNQNSPSRISNLLNKFNIRPIKEYETRFSRNNNIDWNGVRHILKSEIDKSKIYFQTAYKKSEIKKADKKYCNINAINTECTGCAACEEICPKKAISMTLNRKGFFEPLVHSDKCIHCGRCVQQCPLHKKQVIWPKKAYYGWNISPDVLFRSSSGGAFYSIAKYVLQRQGIVFGATYSNDWKDVIFENTDNVQLEKLQKSKYTVSAMSGVYKKLRKHLDSGRIVLFCGTPCQCAGIKAIFDHKYDNLVTCDFVCGGMPSLSFYREHIDVLKKRYNSEITSVDFRPKNWGWGRYRLYIRFSNGKKYIKRDFADPYFKCFISKASVRTICEDCPYFHFHRSDLTIADFWGYSRIGIKKMKGGMSLVVCNNEKAEKIFAEISDFVKHELSIESINYAIRDKIPNDKKLMAQGNFFDLAEKKGFEIAALELYDCNEFHYYLKRIWNMMHI